MKNLWRLIDSEYQDPRKNLALDEALLIAIERKSAPNTLRFWRNLNTVVIGRSSNVEAEVDEEACRKHGTSIVRRFTGGGAVYQDQGNLNWTIIIRRNDPMVKKMRGMLEIYKIVSEPIIEGIKAQGIHAEFKSPNNIYVNGKKVSGMAAYIKKESIFCHGTLLVSSNLDTLCEVLKRLKVEVTALQFEIGGKMSIDGIKSAIVSGFNIAYHVKMKREKLSSIEANIMKALYDEKYSKEEWNLHRERYCLV